MVQLNSTQVSVGLQEAIGNWLFKITQWLASWRGLGSTTLVLLAVMVILFWCLCRTQRRQAGYVLLNNMAIRAMHEGEDPSVWLAMQETHTG